MTEREQPYVSPWWQAILLPDRWDVAGVSVPSLSVWHVFALDQIGNAYARGFPPTRDDAAALLLFAERDLAGGRRLMLGRFRRTRAMRRMHRLLRKIPWPDLHAACRDYVETCGRVPSRGEKAGEPALPAKCPGEWHIIRRLCMDFGMGLEEAWNTPYALARCLNDVSAEANGDRSLLNETEQEIEDEWVKAGRTA